MCDLCDPPLTSVEPDTYRIGYEAADLLSRLMAGEAAPAKRTAFATKRIVVRESSDVFAVAAADLRQALRYIRMHATDGIGVEDIVRAVPLSRRSLERRFREAVGRTPAQEIWRVRIERVEQLLRETDWSLAAIALKAGFRHAEYLSVAFRREVGMTPGEYRATDP